MGGVREKRVAQGFDPVSASSFRPRHLKLIPNSMGDDAARQVIPYEIQTTTNVMKENN
jgi:hypothetical protein